MSRSLTLLFRRDPSRDRHTEDNIPLNGYQVYWPDGRPVALGLDTLCSHGQRLLGLNKQMMGHPERLVEMRLFPLSGREDSLNRIPGSRVRRFYIERQGRIGRLHFMDGTPTSAIYELDRDEPQVLEWLGLPDLTEGGQQWFDLGAVAVETPDPTRPQLQACRA